MFGNINPFGTKQRNMRKNALSDQNKNSNSLYSEHTFNVYTFNKKFNRKILKCFISCLHLKMFLFFMVFRFKTLLQNIFKF